MSCCPVTSHQNVIVSVEDVSWFVSIQLHVNDIGLPADKVCRCRFLCPEIGIWVHFVDCNNALPKSVLYMHIELWGSAKLHVVYCL